MCVIVPVILPTAFPGHVLPTRYPARVPARVPRVGRPARLAAGAHRDVLDLADLGRRVEGTFEQRRGTQGRRSPRGGRWIKEWIILAGW